jgi:GAF domain-containing protein
LSPNQPDLVRQLAAIADDVAPALGLPSADDLLSAICITARHVFAAAACSIALLDEEAGELVYRAADGAGSEEVVGLRLSIGRGIAGYVASSGMAIGVDAVADDPRFAADVAERTGYVPNHLLVVPITAPTGEVMGVLSVLDAGSAGPASAEALDVATAFASQAALALAVASSVERLGSTLLRAMADASRNNDSELATALRRRAASTRGRDAELAALAARIGELRRLGPGITATAGKILDELVAHARAARGRRR